MRNIDAACHLVPNKKNCPFPGESGVYRFYLLADSALHPSNVPGFLRKIREDYLILFSLLSLNKTHKMTTIYKIL